MRAARAWTNWETPISPHRSSVAVSVSSPCLPSVSGRTTTRALLLMFWPLYGATSTPRSASNRQRPAATVDLPTWLAVPAIRIVFVIRRSLGRFRSSGFDVSVRPSHPVPQQVPVDEHPADGDAGDRDGRVVKPGRQSPLALVPRVCGQPDRQGGSDRPEQRHHEQQPKPQWITEQQPGRIGREDRRERDGEDEKRPTGCPRDPAGVSERRLGSLERAGLPTVASPAGSKWPADHRGKEDKQ